jgi:hypothetical protein
MANNTCKFDYTVQICGLNELRVTDNCKKEVRQKLVAATASPNQLDSHWTYHELQDIACFLHDAPEFKTQEFHTHAHLIVNLGVVLTHSHTRESLVHAMLLLMRPWYEACRNDRNCIAPPSRASLGDPNQLKILAVINALETSLEREKVARAILLESTGLDAEQEALLRKSREENQKRKEA